VRVCFKSRRKRCFAKLARSSLITTVSFVDDEVPGRARLLMLVDGDWALVWNGDQKVVPESMVNTGLAMPK
jgi:hypothetical protein